jgi:hypothetical protein
MVAPPLVSDSKRETLWTGHQLQRVDARSGIF